MSKKTKRNRAPEDNALHREACRIRSMPDKQLVEQFHRAAEPEMPVEGPSMAQTASDETGATGDTSAVQRLLCALAEGKCKGVKGATAYKVSQLAKEMGLA